MTEADKIATKVAKKRKIMLSPKDTCKKLVMSFLVTTTVTSACFTVLLTNNFL